jgi:hypothetical protein
MKRHIRLATVVVLEGIIAPAVRLVLRIEGEPRHGLEAGRAAPV